MTRQYQCPWARPYDKDHPVCKSCGIDCALKLASKPLDLTAETSLPRKKGKQPNKTEQAYKHVLEMEFKGCAPRYEAITFHLESGHSYKPDWIVRPTGVDAIHHHGLLLCVEVKNSNYRHASYGRARLAFDQCKIEFPEFTWRWVERTKEGWEIK